MLKEGFFTALGTPIDDKGSIIIESLEKHIEDQISAGASGLLLFGTMGNGGCVRADQFELGIKTAVGAVRKRCALLVGSSENSLGRVAEKLAVCDKEDIDGVVLTPPYYYKLSEPVLIEFMKKAASMTQKDFYLYDHEPITKHKLNYGIVRELAPVANIKGIKSGDLVLMKQLLNHPVKEDFVPIFSGSDLFDVANLYGIKRILDGIFSCMPKSISKAQKAFNEGDFECAKHTLDEMMQVRDLMFIVGIWPAFSYAMNLLGFDGCFTPDYEPAISEKGKEVTKNGLVRLGEL